MDKLAKKFIRRQKQLDEIYLQLIDLHEQQGCFDDETNAKIDQKILDLNADRLLLEGPVNFDDCLMEKDYVTN